MPTLYDFEQPTIDGQPCALSGYRGRVALVVNVASRCGLTPQYAALQELHERFGSRGLSVLGFPCNQFGAQEPGSEADIQAFCSSTYDVSFPMFRKLEVNGAARHPLYAWLTAERARPEGPGDIVWNFAKFLIGRDGHVIGRFSPTTAPTAPELVEAIEAALASQPPA